jgi:hypothetical protein
MTHEKLVKMIVNMTLENFTDSAEYGYGPVVVDITFGTRFVDWDNF